MPSALVEIRRSLEPAAEVALIDAVHEALVEAFRIPVEDKHVRLIAHAPHRFATSPALEHPELYTLVTVDCFAGRTVDAKRRLYAAIVARFAEQGIPPDHVTITVRESATENWGVRGGQAACDVDLGFDLNV